MAQTAAGLAEISVLAVVATYGDLHDCLRRRAIDLNLTRECINDLTLLADGYVSKVLAPSMVRRMGSVSMVPILTALRLRLLIVEDPDTMLPRIADQTKREARNVHQQAPVTGAPVAKFVNAAAMARRGARALNASLTAAERKASASKAARARWNRKSAPKGI